MTLAAILALGASLGWGISDFLGGRKSSALTLLPVLVVSQLASLVLLAGGVMLIGGAVPPGGSVLAAALAGLGEVVGVAALYRGLAVGVTSVVAPAAAVAPALPLVVGLALGDAPTPIRGAGLVVVVLGVVLTAYQRTSAAIDRRRGLVSLTYGLVSAGGFGTFFVAMDAASDGGVPWALLVARLTAVTGVLLVAVTARARMRVARGHLPALALIGILIVAADALYATASTVGELSVVAVLSAFHPVVTIALAWIYLRERVSPIGQAGIALTVCGVIAITATSST
ncbi:DMT family transporter [Actinomycetospora sp. NBC_00405]|uniref:DMT family transporter n=1 Tax=Actinomycetospora sp. NBC_00405 TaxID=2975952 RepID=UPI002E2130CF